jgi:tRNA(adenine34) deaminase
MSSLTPDITPLDEAMMRRALAQAEKAAELGEVPVGAVIYRGEEVLAEAHNRREIDRDPTAHAEMLALRAAASRLNAWRLAECTLAVTLEPCPMCAGAMINARLPRLIYGTADPKMGCVQSLYQLCTDPRFNHRLSFTAGLLAAECGQILTQFFQQLRQR